MSKNVPESNDRSSLDAIVDSDSIECVGTIV